MASAGNAEFSDLFQDGFPALLWQTTMVIGLPLVLYSALALYGFKQMGCSLYVRVWLHRVHERYFISKVCQSDCPWLTHTRSSAVQLTRPVSPSPSPPLSLPRFFPLIRTSSGRRTATLWAG